MKLKSFTELSGAFDGMLPSKELPRVNLCNCTGPQPGETKCPCTIEAEAEAEANRQITTFGRSGG